MRLAYLFFLPWLAACSFLGPIFPERCDEGATAPSCEGNVLVLCSPNTNLLVEIDCGDQATCNAELAGGICSACGDGALDPAELCFNPLASVDSGGQTPIVLAAGDLDGNGTDDIGVLNISGEATLLAGNGAGELTPLFAEPVATGLTAAVLDDFNNAGGIDVALTSVDASQIFLMLLDNEIPIIQNIATGAQPVAITSADLNNDGAPDLITADIGDQGLSVHMGTGGASFAPRQTIALGTEPHDIEAADFNKDGTLDLVVSKNSEASVSLLLGNGDGTFQAPTDFTVDSNPGSLVVADLDRDGDLDLGVVNNDIGISILLGNGAGAFSAQPTLTEGLSPRDLAVGDMNQDGELDLIVANTLSNNLSVLQGNGDGTFVAQNPPLDLGNTPAAVALTDLNRDGALDIVVANQSDNLVSVLISAPK